MHWYDTQGQAAYEVKGANGKMRPTTLRDARKLNLVPSVTTVMSVQDKPGLLQWIKGQILDTVLANPPHPFDDDVQVANWRRRVLDQAQNYTRAAAENGTKIHDSIEEAIKNDFVATTNDIIDVVEPVVVFLKENFGGFEFVAEDSFTHPLGFGGKIDLYGVKNKGTTNERRMVLDFKTKMKSPEEIKKIKAFDDHHLQTAAYAKGLEDTKELGQMMDYQLWERYNLFIGYDINNEGVFSLTGLKLTKSTDFEREWGMFETLLHFWQLKNNYVPGGVK